MMESRGGDRSEPDGHDDRRSGESAHEEPTLPVATPSSFETLWAPTRPAGAKVGRYVVIGTLGEGGMGVVLRAYDPKLQREVALKCLRPEAPSEAQGEGGRLVREAQAMARLSHPNVVAVYDVEQDDEKVIVAMECVEGQTLGQWLHEATPTPAEVLARFIEAGRGLAAAHAVGLLHRDFKPSNVLVSRTGLVKVTDFGLARIEPRHAMDSEASEDVRSSYRESVESSSVVTEAGSIMGTPAYMAPEQHEDGPMTPAVDQYAFCVSLWQALTGVLPFGRGGRDLRRVLARKQDGAPPWPRGLAHVHRRWVEAIRRGLSPEPSARWPGMAALLAELGYDPAKQRRRRVAVGGAILLVAGGLSWQAYGHAETTADCVAEGSALEAVWHAEQAEVIAETFAQTGISYASDTWRRARPRVDAFATDWQRMRTQACLEGERDGQRSADMLARSRSCFDEHKAHLHSLVAQWGAPNATTVNNTVTAAWSLPQLEECLDEAELARRTPPEDDADVFAIHQALRDRLGEASALKATGQYADALAVAEAVLAEASALGQPRLVVDARRSVGNLQEWLGRYEEAKATLETAYAEAEVAGDDEQVFVIASALIFTQGFLLAAPEDGHRWFELASLKRDRIGLEPDDPGVATLLNNLGSLHYRAERYAEALAAYEQSLRLWEQTLGLEHPDVANFLNNIGSVLAASGRHEEALVALQRALAIAEKVLGPDHPEVAYAHQNIGTAYERHGQHEEALVSLERALSIREQGLGPDHPDLAYSLNNLGIVYGAQGKHEKALTAHQRALAIWEQALGPEHLDVATSYNNIGTAHLELGRYEEALTAHRRALAIREPALGPDHPDIADCLVRLGKVHIAQAREADAVPLLERALEIRTKAKAAPAEQAEVRALLARSRGNDPPRRAGPAPTDSETR